MIPEFDFDDVRDFVLALLLWALGGWILWTIRGWTLGVPGNLGVVLLGAINLISLLYIFVLMPLKNLISTYMSGEKQGG